MSEETIILKLNAVQTVAVINAINERMEKVGMSVENMPGLIELLTLQEVIEQMKPQVTKIISELHLNDHLN